jgi:hypothetical protein
MKIPLTLTHSPAFAGERGLVQSFPSTALKRDGAKARHPLAPCWASQEYT